MRELKEFARFVSPIVHRIKNMVGKFILSAVYDTGSIQLIKVSGLESEVLDSVERLQDYGFSSVPPLKNSEVLILAMGGNRDHPVAIKADCGKFRPKNNTQGVVTMYDMFDNLIKMSEGKIEHTSESIELNGNSKFFVTHAELDTALQTFITALNAHTHAVAVTVVGAAGTGTATLPITPMSLNIASAKTTTIKTGG